MVLRNLGRKIYGAISLEESLAVAFERGHKSCRTINGRYQSGDVLRNALLGGRVETAAEFTKLGFGDFTSDSRLWVVSRNDNKVESV